ncbi:MAG: ABC transporter ATP-binding protein, partial [Rhodanobacter sp.]|nr:ABC transporter ATP-binding protein [Rhodanobacter sp.]
KLFELADAGTTLLVSTHLMDEAERCHRLAILDHGVLVADGTPRELTGRLAGRTFIVEAAEPRRSQKLIAGVPGVLSVAQIGNSLRILTTDLAAMGERTLDTCSEIDDVLARAGLQGQAEATPANLEDVFVAVTRNDENQRKQAA